MKYKCLILDHDDTVADSSATIHYPAHLEIMRRFRPNLKPVDLETWFLKNFDPGIAIFLTEELGLSKKELSEEYRIWQEFTKSRIPKFYPGMADLLKRYKEAGGIITVVSHSERNIIIRDYHKNAEFKPDLIFGWDFDENKRKPHPYPVYEILKTFKLKPEEALVIDDLKPAVLMARESGVSVGGAGWAHNIKQIKEYMVRECDFYFSSIKDLSTFLFGGTK